MFIIMVGGGDLHDLLMSMILHFENERGISHELQKLEESGYDLNLNLLTISYQARVSYLRRSGLVEKKRKNNHLRLIRR